MLLPVFENRLQPLLIHAVVTMSVAESSARLL
jgi:hypothetical protein